MQPFGRDPMGGAGMPPQNSIDRESTEEMLISGAGAQGTAFGSSDSEDMMYPEANPMFGGGGEQKFSEFFDPGPEPEMGEYPGAVDNMAAAEPQGDDRAGMHQALVDQYATLNDNSEGLTEQNIEQNKQTTKPYNM